MLIRSATLALLLAFSPLCLCCAQGDKTSSADSLSTETRRLSMLETVGMRVLHALKSKDVQILASVVDERGITLGTDAPPISAAVFRHDLYYKRGSYCVLVGCVMHSGNLRTELSGITTKIHVSLPTTFPNTGQVDVFDIEKASSTSGGPPSTLLTLFFIWRHGEWRLQQIEYT